MDITPSAIQNFFQTLSFQLATGMQQVPTFWKKIATEVPSNSTGNLYPFLSAIPGYREWVGARQINNVAARSFAVPNKHWEVTHGIDRTQFEDDSYGFYGQMMPAVTRTIAEWRDRELARVVEAGTSSLCWDGQYFFDTDHPVDPDNSGAGQNSNLLVGATYDIAGNSGDPLVAFAAARAKMALWKREDGQQLGTIGNLIMCHPNEEVYALKVANALMTAQAVGSAAAGVTNVFQGKVEVLVNPFLTVTSGKPWYLLCTDRGINPFLWQNRQAPNFVQKTQVNDDNVFYLKRFEWGVDERGAATYSFPFLAFRMSSS